MFSPVMALAWCLVQSPWQIVSCHGPGMVPCVTTLEYFLVTWPWHGALCGPDMFSGAMALAWCSMSWPWHGISAWCSVSWPWHGIPCGDPGLYSRVVALTWCLVSKPHDIISPCLHIYVRPYAIPHISHTPRLYHTAHRPYAIPCAPYAIHHTRYPIPRTPIPDTGYSTSHSS